MTSYSILDRTESGTASDTNYKPDYVDSLFDSSSVKDIPIRRIYPPETQSEQSYLKTYPTVPNEKFEPVSGFIESEPSNSTDLDDDTILFLQMNRELVEVFESARGESFEDGVETDFSRQLEVYIKRHDKQGISTIRDAYRQQKFPEQYIAEALLWISDMEHDSTRNIRRTLLEDALDSESVFIRDAAVSGLSYLGDPQSIGKLQETLENESVQGIRENIKGVLQYLQEIQSDSFYDGTSPLDKILGIFDDGITDMSTSVRDTMDKLHRKMYESTD